MDASDHYKLPAIALHWLMAILLISLIALGYYMEGLPKNTSDRAYFFALHKSMGLVALALILVRIGWRATHVVPAPLPGMPTWEIMAAAWSHRLLYLCMFLQPLTGYLSSSFNKYGIKFFGVSLPNWGWEDTALRELFAGAHDVVGMALIALIVVHVLAALKHGLIDKDQIFQRMLPKPSR